MADGAEQAGVTVLARAKVNLTLHVTGRRGDGYHLLDSLVVFAGIGDRITVTPAPDLSLALAGPCAASLSATDNLVLRAARLMGGDTGAAIVLEKVLPVAAGLGGGSADAAATVLALAALSGMTLPERDALLTLGADVPACLEGHPLRMQGIGETLTPVCLPDGWLVLANPGVQVLTRAVFARLDRHDHAPMPVRLPALATLGDLAAFLRTMRNDLEPAATLIAPAIGTCREALSAQPGCLMARMSGSGATCYGLFARAPDAAAAAGAIRSAHPGWWVMATPMPG